MVYSIETNLHLLVKRSCEKGYYKVRSKAPIMLFDLQPFLKIFNLSKSMILVDFKVDFDHFFGLKKKLLIARKQLIVIWTDVNRVPFQKLVGVCSMKLPTRTTDWDKNVCTVSTFSIQEKVLICPMLSSFWPLGLSSSGLPLESRCFE